MSFKEGQSDDDCLFWLGEFDCIRQKIEQALHVSSAVSINILEHPFDFILRFKYFSKKNTICILYLDIVLLYDCDIFLI